MLDENQKFCPKCGHHLIEKEEEHEGIRPFCPVCNAFRYPFFNVACSMIVLSPDQDEILLIKQYSRDKYILVAGYINRGEDAEDAVKREIQEELGVEIVSLHFNHSHFFKPSNTLMLNYTVVLKTKKLKSNYEIDSYSWFSLNQAKEEIYRPSLASQFLDGYLTGNYHFGG